tara:strand:+ start:1793 stop:3382 length:1590 start_codon:yes stop_codon:yes gene_type:complete
MDFLDGFLIRDMPISKSDNTITVKSVLYEKIENLDKRELPMHQIKQEIEAALEQMANPILNKTKVKKTKLGDNPTTASDKEVMFINNAIIMSGIWQIKDTISKEVFTYLQSVFQNKGRKRSTIRNIEEGQEATLELLIKTIKSNGKVSVNLQNKLYDFGLLETSFLLSLEDMVKRGERKIHPSIFSQLTELKKKPKGAAPSSEYSEYKPTELYEKVMQTLEKISGKTRPNREALNREYQLIRNKKKTSATNLVRLLIANRYRVQGRGSIEDYKKIVEKLGINTNNVHTGLYEDWNNIIEDFKSIFEYEDEITGEMVEELEYNTNKLDNKIEGKWQLKDDKQSISFEDFRGKEYIKKIKKLEEKYYQMIKYFKAIDILGNLLKEKDLLNETMYSDLSNKTQEFKEEFKLIKNGVKDYAKLTNQIKAELKEVRAEREADEQLNRMKREANLPDDVYGENSEDKEKPEEKPEEKPKEITKPKHQSKADKLSSKERESMHISTKEKSLEEWLNRMGVQRDKLQELLEQRRKKE